MGHTSKGVWVARASWRGALCIRKFIIISVNYREGTETIIENNHYFIAIVAIRRWHQEYEV
jgi:hypothetical protein